MRKTYTPQVRAWAARKAREVRQRADQVRAEKYPSADWRRVRRKMDVLSRLASEAAKFDRIAGTDFDDSPTPF